MMHSNQKRLTLTLKGNSIDQLTLNLHPQAENNLSPFKRRAYFEMPSFIAEQQGISPITFQLAVIESLEELFQVKATQGIQQLRRLLYLAERIYNHGIHIHFLSAPDVYGYESASQMGQHHPEFLQRGLLIQEAGKMLVSLLTQSTMQDKGLRVGGFAIRPNQWQWKRCAETFQYAYIAAKQLVEWSARVDIEPERERFMWVSLKDETTYPVNQGCVFTSAGTAFAAQAYGEHFQVSGSHNQPILFKGQDYLVGPLARINNNFAVLPAAAKQLAYDNNLHFPHVNMHASLQARALECFAAIDESLNLLQQGLADTPLQVPYHLQPGQSCICIEAPRGLTYYQQSVNEQGAVTRFTLIPPTRQNQARIEQDLHYSITQYGLNKSERELRKFCERIIRNYEPHLPKNTHFLDLQLTRT